ncbi:hypothetical protein LCGC14_0417960 [marine sediment metagenome]|uniref:Uncharacterized protein n=1 Tax=marine sediment metagenome TaxID=412755 RepID=A0A0F9SRV6_9ZZZZ
MFGLADGKVTYTVGSLTILYAVVGYLLGQLDFVSAGQLVSTSLLAMGVRSGIAKGK